MVTEDVVGPSWSHTKCILLSAPHVELTVKTNITSGMSGCPSPTPGCSCQSETGSWRAQRTELTRTSRAWRLGPP